MTITMLATYDVPKYHLLMLEWLKQDPHVKDSPIVEINE